VEISSTN